MPSSTAPLQSLSIPSQTSADGVPGTQESFGGDFRGVDNGLSLIAKGNKLTL